MTERTRLFWLFLAGGLLIGGIAVADPFGSVPHAFQADTVISASQMNANFESISDYISQLEARVVDTEARIVEAEERILELEVLPPDITAWEVPAGTVVAYAGPMVPEGWHICDGSMLSRAEYPALFQAIGTVHGHGDGATTFHLPDYRGRFLRGVDGLAGRDPDRDSRTAMNTAGNTGNAVGTVQGGATARPSAAFSGTTASAGAHTHTLTVYRMGNDGGSDRWHYSNSSSGGSNTTLTTSSSGAHTHTFTIAGGGDAETRPINAAVHYIIKL